MIKKYYYKFKTKGTALSVRLSVEETVEETVDVCFLMLCVS